MFRPFALEELIEGGARRLAERALGARGHLLEALPLLLGEAEDERPVMADGTPVAAFLHGSRARAVSIAASIRPQASGHSLPIQSNCFERLPCR